MPSQGHGQSFITKIKHKKIRNKTSLALAIEEDTKRVGLNKLVLTLRKPTKRAKKLCTQLRRILSPNSLSQIKENYIEFLECLKAADQNNIKIMIQVHDNELHIGLRPKGGTYIFKILEYDEKFNQHNAKLYTKPAFTTFEGKNEHIGIFREFTMKTPQFKRVIHIHSIENKIYLRHYVTKMIDTEDDFRMSLKETGPRLTLELKQVKEGFFEELRKTCRKNLNVKFKKQRQEAYENEFKNRHRENHSESEDHE